MKTLYIDGHSLTIADVREVAFGQAQVYVKEEAKQKILKARALVERKVANSEIVYGLTTGFGEFKNIAINKDQTKELQDNLIASHSIGVGEPFSEPIVRAATLIRANSLSSGNSGVRLETVEALLDIINHNIYPFVPSRGSVGASGDLAPLSHLVLCRMGLGEVIEDGKRKDSKEFLQKIGLQPLVLTSKEGLALNNGTAFMSAIAVLNLTKSEQLIKIGDIISGMSLEALMGTISACDPKIHQLRPHQGQINTAANLRSICANSKIMESHKNCGRVQDSYTLRCTPQVHGAVKDTYNHVKSVVEKEINSVTDNPLIFPDEDQVISGGNFHGEPLAFIMDFLGIAISELGNISERRTFKLLTGSISEGLPPFLIPADKGGLNSGYMIAQYTAAALLAENKVLAHPASVDSIPTSANQEDHVSFGMTAAVKAQKIIDNVEQILAIELMCATQALDFRKPFEPGQGSGVAQKTVREVVPFLDKDRVLYKDLEKIVVIISKVVSEVEKTTGTLAI